MIRFALRCESGHEFEAWFRSGDGFEAQQQAGEITCPDCGDTKVDKALMAPSIGRSRDKVPALTPAQAETLAIVAYLQPVSRPEIARIRGVNAESAAATLLERGLIEEAGRSQFGAVLYRTTDLFLRLFGLNSLQELPELSAFDPAPELEAELRQRLLQAGEARAAS